MDVILELQLRLLIPISGYKLDHQRVLDRKDGIVIKILAVLVEYLCRDGLVPFQQNLYRHTCKSMAPRVRQWTRLRPLTIR